jgi:phenylacetate-coenzyme A ligase PaaK-like adenylate-forming protein
MPLIRFWVGDKGLKLRAKCNCGCAFDLMQPLAGRASDYIALQDGAQLSPFRITTSIEKTRGLLQYQIVQETEKVLCMRVIFEDPYFEMGCHEIKQTLEELTAGKMTIRIDRCDRINVETNGKFKVVKNLLPSKDLQENYNGSSPR